MLQRRIIYFLLFAGCIWLALATRKYTWFHPLIIQYGGDVVWSGAFLFLLRAIFIHVKSWKLAVVCYVLGVLDECSQLLNYDWIVAIRQTYIGRLMLGVGFVWSDLLCYAVGVVLALLVILLLEKWPKQN